MCTGGGGNARQEQDVRNQNAVQAQQFRDQQAFAQERADQDQLNFDTSFAFQQDNANRSFAAQASAIARQVAKEAEREGQIQGSIDSIDSAFSGRDGLFNQLEDDSFELSKSGLDQNRGIADRNLAFALSRAGRRFDSLEVDKSAQIGDRYNEGLVDSRAFSGNLANTARINDASLKQGLLSSAASGAFKGDQLIAGAQNSLDTIASAPPRASTVASNGAFFADIPQSINQLAALFGGQNRGSSSPGSRGSGQGGGSVSSTGV